MIIATLLSFCRAMLLSCFQDVFYGTTYYFYLSPENG